MGRLTRIPRLVVRRKSFEWCILSNRGNTGVAQARLSGGQTAAALAAPGGNDGAAGARPHPQTKAMGTAATPITRLECALAHGKTPTIFGVLDNQVRCSLGTHRRWSGQVAAVAVSDLLTVRGTAKPVKPAPTWGDCGIVGANVQSTRRTSWRISATRLRREAAIANVPVRLTVSGSEAQAATFIRR